MEYTNVENKAQRAKAICKAQQESGLVCQLPQGYWYKVFHKLMALSVKQLDDEVITSLKLQPTLHT